MKTYMRIITAAAMAISFSLAGIDPVYSQDRGSAFTPSDISGISRTVKSPEGLASWLSDNFRYQMQFPDNPRPMEEVMASRAGDCDDFAFLSSKILSEMKIQNRVLIVSFRGLSVKHAVCAYRNSAGYYSFMSNKEIIRTEERDIDIAVASVYPDCERFEDARTPRSRLA